MKRALICWGLALLLPVVAMLILVGWNAALQLLGVLGLLIATGALVITGYKNWEHIDDEDGDIW